MSRFDSLLTTVNRHLIVWMMGLMVAMVFVNVVLRYLFDYSLLWAEELSRYLMIWATFLGSGLLFRQGAHIAVDNLQDYVPGRFGMAIRAAIVVVLISFFVSMIYIGTVYVSDQWHQITPVTRISVGAVYAALPVGFILMLYHLLAISPKWIRDREVAMDADGSLFSD